MGNVAPGPDMGPQPGAADLALIPQHYSGAVGLLIATGPSLTSAQIERARWASQHGRLATFGCNDAYRICEYLDILYAADGRWIDYHRRRIPGYLLHGQRCWTPDQLAVQKYAAWSLVGLKARPGLSLDRSYLHSGNHSGYQMINFAYLMGCTTLILLGYDCRSGGHHWFGQHPEGPMRVTSNFTRWVKVFDAVATQAEHLDLTIINATPDSAIDAFPRMDLGEALDSLGCLA